MMAFNAPTKIESVLLYQECEKLDPQKVLRYLNLCMESADIRFNIVQEGPHGEFVFLMGGRMNVLISQSSTPLGMEGFGPTLASSYTQHTFKNADEVVHKHKQHMSITVKSELSITEAPEFQKLLKDTGLAQSQSEFEVKLKICQLLTGYFARNTQPTAIHWIQSDSFFTPETYLALSSDLFPIPLFVHPVLFSSRNVVNGVPVLGLRTFGASHLIGYEIMFIEAPAPLSWLFERTCNFINMVRDQNSLIPDGESFGANKDEVIRVRHRAPSDDNPSGLIELHLEACADFEVKKESVPGSQPPMVEEEREVMLDHNNPIDRAILESLKQTGQQMRDVVEPECGEQNLEEEFLQQMQRQAASFGQRSSKLFH